MVIKSVEAFAGQLIWPTAFHLFFVHLSTFSAIKLASFKLDQCKEYLDQLAKLEVRSLKSGKSVMIFELAATLVLEVEDL